MHYVDGGYTSVGDTVPTIAGLAITLGISRQTCYAWQDDQEKQVFSYIIDKLKQVQERALVNKGLLGEYHPQITKVMLARHGYSDKQEIDHSSSDGSMSPKPTVIELVGPSDESSA